MAFGKLSDKVNTMTSPSVFPSSPIIESYSATPESGSFIQSDCFKYHLQLDTVHAKIYRYNSFSDLLQFLKTTLHIHYPYIDYPSDEILYMILTGTQLNHVEDGSSTTLVNLSGPCLEYISHLFNILETPEQFNDNNIEQQSIYEEEISRLYDKLCNLFSFLKPDLNARRTKRRRINANNSFTNAAHSFNINESSVAYSMEENMNLKDNDLRHDKTSSLFEISTTSDKYNNADSFFGVKYLHETEKNIWKYVMFSFQTASRLTEIDQADTYESYNQTWIRWREFLYIILRFMNIELRRSPNAAHTLFTSNLLQNKPDPYDASQEDYLDSLLSFVEYVFTDLKCAYEIMPIIETDLTLSKKYIFSCNPSMIEYKYRGSGICLDSLPLRSEFLSTCWKYLDRLPIENTVKSKFCNKIAKQLLNFKPKELMDFFFNASLLMNMNKVRDDIFFIISFEILRLLNRAWTLTADNFDENYFLYLEQLKILFDSFNKKNISNQSNAGADESLIILQESFNDDLEKCFIIARFQLKSTINFLSLVEEEWKQLNDIKFDFDDKNVCMGDIAKRLLTSSS